MKKQNEGSRGELDSKTKRRRVIEKANEEVKGEETSNGGEDSKVNFDHADFFDFSNESSFTQGWVSQFLDLDNNLCEFSS
ncbi:hypothetical protein CsSME_00035606 [Camellia sinensis var. sinensis]